MTTLHGTMVRLLAASIETGSKNIHNRLDTFAAGSFKNTTPLIEANVLAWIASIQA